MKPRNVPYVPQRANHPAARREGSTVKRWHRSAATLAVLAAGIVLGRVSGAASHREAVRQAQQTEQELSRQLFEAVRRHLEGANLPPRDLPKEILAVKPLGDRRYQVHMAMGLGEGWFEVWWDGAAWQVKGINPPQAPQGSPAPPR